MGIPKSFKIEAKNKPNVFMISLAKQVISKQKEENKSEETADKENFYFLKPLQVNLAFYQLSGADSEVVVCECFRRKGDYLTFVQFYCFLWGFFNQ